VPRVSERTYAWHAACYYWISMKPRNFPGRKHLRRIRAEARRLGKPQPDGDPSVVDIHFRCGATNRDADGLGRMVPA